jgi:hypothetical protein
MDRYIAKMKDLELRRDEMQDKQVIKEQMEHDKRQEELMKIIDKNILGRTRRGRKNKKEVNVQEVSPKNKVVKNKNAKGGNISLLPPEEQLKLPLSVLNGTQQKTIHSRPAITYFDLMDDFHFVKPPIK